MEILSLELVRMEDSEKAHSSSTMLQVFILIVPYHNFIYANAIMQNKPPDEKLRRRIADLENELNQERVKFRQEYFAVEEEKKEVIAMRSRMDEYERGVYGLADAMYVSSTLTCLPSTIE